MNVKRWGKKPETMKFRSGRDKYICRQYATPLKDLKMGERTLSDNTAEGGGVVGQKQEGIVGPCTNERGTGWAQHNRCRYRGQNDRGRVIFYCCADNPGPGSQKWCWLGQRKQADPRSSFCFSRRKTAWGLASEELGN